MAHLLYVMVHATDAPERVATALAAAADAAKGGAEVGFWLQDEGVRLGVEGVLETFAKAGGPDPASVVEQLVAGGARLYLSRRCFERREFEADALRAGGELVEAHRLAALVDEGWVPVPT